MKAFRIIPFLISSWFFLAFPSATAAPPPAPINQTMVDAKPVDIGFANPFIPADMDNIAAISITIAFINDNPGLTFELSASQANTRVTFGAMPATGWNITGPDLKEFLTIQGLHLTVTSSTSAEFFCGIQVTLTGTPPVGKSAPAPATQVILLSRKNTTQVDPSAAVPNGRQGAANHTSRVTLLLGTEYSNVYRQTSGSGFFSQSKGMLILDLDHRIARTNTDQFVLVNTDVGVRGAFGTSTVDASGIATASDSFISTASFAYMFPIGNPNIKNPPDAGGFALGPIFGVTWASYPVPETNQYDRIRSVPELGTHMEWALGSDTHLSSFSNLTIQKDSLYIQPLRFSCIGRVIYHGLVGSISAFLEGEINISLENSTPNPGRLDKDVGYLRLGVILDPKSLFDSVAKMFQVSTSTSTPTKPL